MGISHLTTSCKTILIDDLPAGKDLLGAHSAIAATISELLLHESGGRALGLIGRWGSGKSTIINLVRANVAKSSRPLTLVHSFDAWAHQGDPLRRSFLESVVAGLSEAGWINQVRWQSRMDEIARKRRVEERKLIPQLSWLAITLALSVVLIPVGVALWSRSLDSLSIFQFDQPFNLRAVTGLFLILLPLLIFAIAVIPYLLCLARNDWKPCSECDHLRDRLSLMAAKEIHSSRSEITETPDPTSIEFERLFCDLMGEALNGDDKRLVIVLDNLDRVDARDALAVWTTLQVFLWPNLSRQPWAHKLWLIVPFDDTALARMWRRSEVMQDELVAPFLAKNFQLSFDVPPPLLTNWHDYLISQLSSAFPDHDEEEFHAVYRLCAHKNNVLREVPTPRDLKLFVNAIGSLHRLWCGKVGLASMAYFVLNRAKVSADSLISSELFTEEEKVLLGRNAREELASLAYGLVPEIAGEVLLEAPLMRALEGADGEAIRNLSGGATRFGTVLEMVVRKGVREWSVREGGLLGTAATALSESGVYDLLSMPLRGSIIRELNAGIRKAEIWTPVGNQAIDGIFDIAKRSSDPDLLSAFFPRFSASQWQRLAPPESGTVSTDEVKAWVSAFVRVFDGLRGMGAEVASARGVVVPGSMEVYCEVASQLAALGRLEYSGRFRPSSDRDAASAWLVGIIEEGSFRDRHVICVAGLLAGEALVDPQQVSDALRARLTAGNGVSLEELCSGLGCMETLTGVLGREPLDSFVKEGHAAHYISASSASNDQDALVTLLYWYLKAAPHVVRYGILGQGKSGYAILEREVAEPREEVVGVLFKYLSARNDTRLIWEVLAEDGKGTPMALALLERLAADPGASIDYDPGQIVDLWPVLSTSKAIRLITGVLVRSGGLLTVLPELGFRRTLASLYTAALSEGGAENVVFANWCREQLRSVNREGWEEALKEGLPLVGLAEWFAVYSPGYELGVQFASALEVHSKWVMESSDDNHAGTNISLLTTLLPPGSLKMFRDSLFESAKRSEGGMSKAFFEAYGHELAEADGIGKERTTLSEIVLPIVEKHNVQGLEWVRRLLQSKPDVIGRFDKGYVKTFRERLRQEVDGPEEWEGKDIAKDVAILAGVDFDKGKR